MCPLVCCIFPQNCLVCMHACIRKKATARVYVHPEETHEIRKKETNTRKEGKRTQLSSLIFVLVEFLYASRFLCGRPKRSLLFFLQQNSFCFSQPSPLPGPKRFCYSVMRLYHSLPCWLFWQSPIWIGNSHANLFVVRTNAAMKRLQQYGAQTGLGTWIR